jgi:hypothetical protein
LKNGHPKQNDKARIDTVDQKRNVFSKAHHAMAFVYTLAKQIGGVVKKRACPFVVKFNG